MNKTGTKRSFRNRVSAVIVMLFLSGVGLFYLLPTSSRDPGGRTSTATTVRKQRTAGELKQRVLRRPPPVAVTNTSAPFVSALGPGAASYLGGMAALRELPAVLSSNQVETLRSLVATAYSTYMALSPLEFNGVKNVAADILLQQPNFPAELLADLALQSGDPAQDEVWRDYCLQMLTTGYLNLVLTTR